MLSGQLLSDQLLSGISQSDGQPKLGNHRNTQRLEKLESLDKINDEVQKEGKATLFLERIHASP